MPVAVPISSGYVKLS